MIRKYTYKEKEYLSVAELRQELFKQERKSISWPDPSIGVDEMNNQLNKYAITYTEEPDPEPTDEELAAAARNKRDYLMTVSDFLAMPDYPLGEEERSAVMTYRQALRDVPAQEGFPREITWPEAPALLSAKVAKIQTLWGDK